MINLVERIPIEKALFILDMKFYTFKQYTKRCSNDNERNKLFNELKKLCKEVIDGLGTVNRSYDYSKDMGINGRLFSNGIQGTMREFRGFLMGDNTTDIDMANAHPNILRYLCKKHSIPCASLEYYVNNRDEILKSFEGITREDAKTLFLKSLNNEKLNKNIKNEHFRKFDNEVKKIQKALTEKTEYADIVNTIPDNKDYNVIGSKINRILCYYENEILQVALKTLQENNVEVATLMFDGCMVYGNHYNNDEILNTITGNVNKQFEGLNMKWTYKKHDNSIVVPADWKPNLLGVKERKKTLLVLMKKN